MSKKSSHGIFVYFLAVLAAITSLAMIAIAGKAVTDAAPANWKDLLDFAVFVVLALTLFAALRSQISKNRSDASEAILDRSLDLVQKAYEVLKRDDGDLTNARVNWVTAARLLTRAESLSCKITLEHHQNIFHSEHDYYRHRFGELLRPGGVELPTEFFLGPDYVEGDIGASALAGCNPSGATTWIPTPVLAVVYRFASYPDGYEDPLTKELDFSDREHIKLRLMGDRGTADYLVFRRKFTSISEHVVELQPGADGQPLTADQINSIELSVDVGR